MTKHTVNWPGEDGLCWQATVGIRDGIPCLFSLGYGQGEGYKQVAGPLTPTIQAVTGIRKPTGQSERQSLVRDEEAFYEARWNTYADHPMSRKDEVKKFFGKFSSTTCTVQKTGAVTTVDFDGLDLGYFTGGYRISFYDHSNLIKLEAIASTNEPSLAYFYRQGLRGFALGQLHYRSLDREMITELPRRGLTLDARRYDGMVRVNARNRILTLGQENGAVSVFPPPHKFFWARQNENCVGYNFCTRYDDDTVAIGVRHNESHEMDGDRWALYNAPPGTRQHMPFFLAVSAGNVEQCRETAMNYTNNDVFRELPGYKRMLAHFHMAHHVYWEQDPDRVQPWETLFQEMGCDIAMLCDFWVDGEQGDTGEARKQNLMRYHQSCVTHSTDKFLILPAEEMAERPTSPWKPLIPGHWMFLPSKPILYARHREEGQPFVKETPDGPYYRWGSPEDILETCRRENCILFMPHPETKANDGYPMELMDEPWYNDPRYWGMAFRYLPADWSTERLIDGRTTSVWDEMNNQSAFPRYCMGELDTYEKDLRFDMYGDMNVTYVKLDKLPPPTDWTELVEALKRGDAFVSTGEVLIDNYYVTDGSASATFSWSFPLEFAEVVYSDGETVKTERIDMSDCKPFDRRDLAFQFPRGMKWARLAAWDIAGNGAFHQPVFLQLETT